MDSLQKILVLGALTLSLSGCAGTLAVDSNSEAPSSQPTETLSEAKQRIAAEDAATSGPSNSPTAASPVTRTEVPWADYDPGIQEQIDLMTTANDCNGIQSFFGMTTATEEAIKARTGHGNEKLVSYLNESLTIAQCN